MKHDRGKPATAGVGGRAGGVGGAYGGGLGGGAGATGGMSDLMGQVYVVADQDTLPCVQRTPLTLGVVRQDVHGSGSGNGRGADRVERCAAIGIAPGPINAVINPGQLPLVPRFQEKPAPRISSANTSAGSSSSTQPCACRRWRKQAST